MSADRVDVLSVLDREIEILDSERHPQNTWIEEDWATLVKARAGIAELIDKATQILSHNPAHCDTHEEAELRAALSRIAQPGDSGE